MTKQKTPERRLLLSAHESERIRADLLDYPIEACARAAGVSAGLLVRAAAQLPLRQRDAERVRASIETFTPLNPRGRK